MGIEDRINSVLNSIPHHVDYAGQAKAEHVYRFIISLFSGVGLCWGYIVQQFSQCVYILGAGFLLAAVLTVPPWPMYRRKPLAWQQPQSTPVHSQHQPHQPQQEQSHRKQHAKKTRKGD